MITEAIINFVYYIINGILLLLPSYSGLPSGLEGAIGYMFKLIAGISGFVPMPTIWTIFFLWASIEIGILIFRFIAWALHWKTTGG